MCVIFQTQRSRTTKRPWSDAENEQLKQAIRTVGMKRWNDVAALVPGRQGIQCMQHWQQVVDPSLVKGLWTSAEDSKLKQIKLANPNMNWSVPRLFVCSSVSPVFQVSSEASPPSPQSSSHSLFSGRRTDVAEQTPGRSSKQCRERWTTNVNPQIKVYNK